MQYRISLPNAIDPMWLISPKLALLLTLPDPPPDGKVFGQIGVGM